MAMHEDPEPLKALLKAGASVDTDAEMVEPLLMQAMLDLDPKSTRVLIKVKALLVYSFILPLIIALNALLFP